MEDIDKQISLLRKLLKESDIAEARILCQKLISAHPAHPEINYLMGFIYDKLHFLKRADEFLQKALNLDPNHYETLVELSLFHEKNGNHDRASLYRERAFRLANKIDQS